MHGTSPINRGAGNNRKAVEQAVDEIIEDIYATHQEWEEIEEELFPPFDENLV